MSRTRGRNFSIADEWTSSLYDLWIRGFPLRSRMAMRLATMIVETNKEVTIS